MSPFRPYETLFGGRLAAKYGDQYLGGFMGQWRCMKCAAVAPYSWWRTFTGQGLA